MHSVGYSRQVSGHWNRQTFVPFSSKTLQNWFCNDQTVSWLCDVWCIHKAGFKTQGIRGSYASGCLRFQACNSSFLNHQIHLETRGFFFFFFFWHICLNVLISTKYLELRKKEVYFSCCMWMWCSGFIGS